MKNIQLIVICLVLTGCAIVPMGTRHKTTVGDNSITSVESRWPVPGCRSSLRSVEAIKEVLREQGRFPVRRTRAYGFTLHSSYTIREW